MKERVATITLNCPERFNAISETMPQDIATAFGHANNDDSVHVVVLTGAGRGFCGGYDIKAWAEEPGTNPVMQDMPWDPMIDYNFMSRCTQSFMSIWRCHKPVIARVHGDAVAGGSDIALSVKLAKYMYSQYICNRLIFGFLSKKPKLCYL